MITYRVGDATVPEGDGPRLIPHICNDVGGWGAGFVLALSARWTEPEAQYVDWWGSGEGFELGAVQFVPVEPGLEIANMLGQRDVVAIDGVAPVRYEALEEALASVAERALQSGASVHMPRIGAGLAGGDWATIEAIIERTLLAAGVAVTVYDLPSV